MAPEATHDLIRRAEQRGVRLAAPRGQATAALLSGMDEVVGRLGRHRPSPALTDLEA